jgi:hypothetical protein
LVVLFMRQTVVAVRWWQVLPFAGAAAYHAAGGFPAFFSRYLAGTLITTAVLLPLVPTQLASALPDVLFRIGLLRRGKRD